MVNKEDLIKRLDTLIDDTRNRQGGIAAMFGGLIRTVSDISGEAIDLEKEIAEASDDVGSVLEKYKRVLELEGRFRRQVVRLTLLPATLLVYFVAVGLFFLLRYVDLSTFVQKTLGVQAPGKLISLGVSGAFIYLTTSLLSRSEASGPSQFSAVLNFSLRLLLAIVVPILLVVLFFNSDGSLKKLTVNVELLSFACGYSAKLVVDLLAKIVEKGSKMIAAI